MQLNLWISHTAIYHWLGTPNVPEVWSKEFSISLKSREMFSQYYMPSDVCNRSTTPLVSKFNHSQEFAKHFYIYSQFELSIHPVYWSLQEGNTYQQAYAGMKNGVLNKHFKKSHCKLKEIF